MTLHWVGLVVASTTLLAACSDTGGLAARDRQVYAPGPAADTAAAEDPVIVGHRLMEAGQHELAIKAFYRAAAAEGQTAEILAALGWANIELGRLGQAERLLRNAVEADQTYAPAWNNLGVVLIERGEFGEAERVFRRAFALDSGESPMIRENLRLALAKLENSAYDGAKQGEFALVRQGGGVYQLRSRP